MPKILREYPWKISYTSNTHNTISDFYIPALECHSKLMVLGKPGAGKTTFLQYVAMQCIEGRFQASIVPLLITLKDFAEAPKKPDILKFIVQLLSTYGVTHTSVAVEKLLKQGNALVLLDGLDEVREEDTKRVLRQIREFSDLFHTNQFVITCRIAAEIVPQERISQLQTEAEELTKILGAIIISTKSPT